MEAPISLDGVAVHPGCWCVCLYYLHFAPKNPEDGKMYLLVPAHPGCPRQSPESCKMVVCDMKSFVLFSDNFLTNLHLLGLKKYLFGCIGPVHLSLDPPIVAKLVNFSLSQHTVP